HCDEAHAAGHRAAREALAGLLSGNGVTELAVTIESPAVASASGRDAAGVEDPGAYYGEAHAAPHRDRARPVYPGPIAELPVAVGPPATGRARRRDPAAMEIAGAHCGEAQAARHGHRTRPVGRGAVAELAVRVVAPAIGGARGRNSARVAVVGTLAPGGAHRGKPHAAPNERRDRPLGRGAIAELTTAVGAPAIGGACGRDAKTVAGAGRERSERRRCRMPGRPLLAGEPDGRCGQRAEDETKG